MCVQLYIHCQVRHSDTKSYQNDNIVSDPSVAMTAGISAASVVGLVLVIALVIFALRRHSKVQYCQM